MSLPRLKLFLNLILLASTCSVLPATTFYVDDAEGLDSNTGKSAQTAWKSLEKAAKAKLEKGDSILLRRGGTFNGSLKLKVSGSKDKPIPVSSYGEGPLPVINASGYRAGIHIVSASHIVVENLELTGDGGRMVDGSPERERAGVLVNTLKGKPVGHITIRNLFLHDIYPGIGSPHEGRKETSHLGYGVILRGSSSTDSTHFVVENCRIERMGYWRPGYSAG